MKPNLTGGCLVRQTLADAGIFMLSLESEGSDAELNLSLEVGGFALIDIFLEDTKAN